MYRKDKKREVYTVKAHNEGYPARSIYKLKEINEKFRLIGKDYRVLDLGSAPGSWLKYLGEIVGDGGMVVGIDLSELRFNLPKNTKFIQKDIYELSGKELLLNTSGFNAVTSDMAAKTTGIESADSGATNDLVRQGLSIAKEVLVRNGVFIAKLFENNDTKDILKEVKGCFKSARMFRPQATTKHSKEVYLIALGYQPATQIDE